jgi:hypothetical protein
VLDAGGLGIRRARRQDRKLAEKLETVGVDDDAADLAGEPAGQARLAACRRPAEDDDGAVVA